MKFGLMFFASSEDSLTGNIYQLVQECAVFGDQHDFSSIWVPERHFTTFGGVYPNPAILHAALSAITSNIRLNSGSVVMPLHDPLRVAEEWAMVDNLSNGRVGMSIASGWNPDDFAFFPEHYDKRYEVMYDGIETIKKLFKGEKINRTSGNGKPVDIRIFPTPVQNEIPIHITTGGSPENFKKAGALGYNILTHVLDQTLEELAEKIALYRKAREENGFDPKTGVVSLMLHSFVGKDNIQTKEEARKPYCNFLKGNAKLLSGLAQNRGQNVDLSALSEKDMDEFVNFLYDRFANTKGLIGDPESCMELIRDCENSGIDEIACLLDFGPKANRIVENLAHLDTLKNRYNGTISNSENAPSQEVSFSQSSKSIARASAIKEQEAKPAFDLEFNAETVMHRATEQMEGVDFYKKIYRRGVQLTGDFCGIKKIWRGAKEALTQIDGNGIVFSGYEDMMHPAVLDACHQTLSLAIPDAVLGEKGIFLPVGFDSFNLTGALDTSLWCHAILTDGAETSAVQTMASGNLRIVNAEGQQVLEVLGLKMQKVEAEVADKQDFYAKLHYNLLWKQEPLIGPKKPEKKSNWLVLGGANAFEDALVNALRQKGDRAIYATYGDRYATTATDQFTIRANSELDIENLLQHVIEEQIEVEGILFPSAMEASDPTSLTYSQLIALQERNAGQLLLLSRVLVNKKSTVGTPLVYLISKGAERVETTETPDALGALLWGMGRVMSMEYPENFAALLDLDPKASVEQDVEQITTCLQHSLLENQICFRGETTFGLRLEAEKEVEWNPEKVPGVHANKAYVITGGLGNFGIHAAQWLFEQGAEHLYLLGRSNPKPEVQKTIDNLRAIGAQIEIIGADVTEEAEVNDLLRLLKKEKLALGGIIHAAGVYSYDEMANLTVEEMHRVLAPKVRGTLNLTNLARNFDAPFFVSISSLSPIWGSKYLAHYSAANHFQDVFVHSLRAMGIQGHTVNIGPMSGGGMAAQATEYMNKSGLPLISARDAIINMGMVMQENQAQRIITDVNWKVFKDLYELAGHPQLLTAIQVDTIDNVEFAESAFLKSIKEVPLHERRSFFTNMLHDEMARLLNYSTGQRIELDQPLFDIGLDSIIALEYKNKLEKDLGVSLSATLLFNYPSIQALSDYFQAEVLPKQLFEEAVEPKKEENATTEIPEMESATEEELADYLSEKLDALEI